MKSANTSIITGLVLMTGGVLLLLDRLRVLESAAYVPALTFAAAGAVFLSLFLRSRDHWWAAIPGSVFLGLAAVITATQLTPGGADAAFLFLFMGAGFGAVFLRQRTFWWALIPCGVMFTLAVMVALPPGLQGTLTAAVLFLGLAATFGVLAVVPVQLPRDGAVPGQHAGQAGQASGPADRMKWPLIPAAVLAVLGVSFALQSTVLVSAADFVILPAMILLGIALIVYAYRARSNNGHRKAQGS